jgi:hypothetical protein
MELRRETVCILALFVGFTMCQANPKFRFSEPADWQPRVGFMMDGWRFVYIWRPFCPGGFRIGDALTFVDVPPREGLYCVNGNGALAKLATHFEPGYVWESGGFTFFRPTINASDGMNGQYYT